ncbi:MAG: hypothetical protein SFW67_00180 [Myxococcaceae bacterium]|nr:hypothetical protein [Myxococcaceae bacterium]
MRLATGGLALCLLASGCVYSRVTLPPLPEVTAPLEERQAAFQTLSIISIDSTKWFDEARPNVTLKTDLDEVVLGDTTRVEDPRDLLPAVLPESPTARLIAAYDQDVHETTIIKVVVAGSGAVTFAASVALTIAGASAAQQRLPDAAALTTFGVLLSVPAIVALFFGALLPITPPSSARVSAFHRYNDDLAQRLGLR